MVMFSSTRKKRYSKKEKIGYNEVGNAGWLFASRLQRWHVLYKLPPFTHSVTRTCPSPHPNRISRSRAQLIIDQV